MAKSGYKKFKKQEKAKVKLKGNKTLLPKGQNVTDTNFKVKKIIVKEQLKEHSGNEVLTRKHLSIKDLIARLSHHNVGMRQDALSGLNELVTIHGSDIVKANLSPLLQAVMMLIVDREADVRMDTLKLLSALFVKVTEEELSPMFPLIVGHLTCAMTHIEPSVRSDSLRLLDTMLTTLPSLTSAHTPTLLPHFLNLISQQSGQGEARTLSLHLEGRVTSEKWRGKVIGRLKRLFYVISNHIKRDNKQPYCTVTWNSDKWPYLGLYNSVAIGAKNAEDIANLPMKEYAEMLMPLLLDTFVEAVPKQNQGDSNNACVIGVDTAALLLSVVEVILHIWHLLKHTSQPESLTEWFKTKWGESVVTRLILGRFPYSVSGAKSLKRRRDTEQMLAALQVSCEQPSASLLNMQLCLLIFLLSQPGDLWTLGIQYIRSSQRNERLVKPEESTVLCKCLEATSEHHVTPSLLSVICSSGTLTSVDRPGHKSAFHFLTNVALQSSHHLHQDKYFTTWLDSLPGLLCQQRVPLSIVRSVANIATRNLPAFTNSLDGWIEGILGNLPALTVTGDRDKEGPMLIVGLVYWVTDWDQGLVDNVKQLIKQGSLEPHLTSHLVDVLRFKAENTNDPELRKSLGEIINETVC